jgi:hypothetical protein
MHSRVLAAAALVSLALPLGALADRGALSVEAGGVVAGVRSEPAIGAGDSVTGTVAGVTLATRYALSNRVEVTGTVDWFAAAPFYNDNTMIVTGNSAFRGQLQGRLSRYSAKLGAQYVHGLTWRSRVGGEIGWTRVTTERLDLVDVTPTVPRSFGLGLGSRTSDNLVVTGLAGVEWAVSDHVSFAITPRVEFPFGGGLMAITVPLTVSYSWYML